MQAQSVVSGTVTSQSEGETLPGVNVVIKGTTTGTITDGSGAFSLSVPNPETAVLQFTYIGFETREIPVNNRSVINVQLTSDLTQLEEVVVVGYGEQARGRVTAAVSTVDTELMESRPTAGVDNLLQGLASGVQVVQGTGQPGDPATVRIRGAGSFSAGNDPLYVIDGVPMISSPTGGVNPLADLNPNDIASISVLKDAASAAIYGSRAANGVILITTKKGKRGTARFNANVYTGSQRILRNLPVLDARSARQLWREKWVYGNRGIPNVGLPPDNRYRTEAIDTLSPNMGLDAQTDWQDLLFDWAPVTNADVSARGGTEDLTYSVSGQFFDQEGILINSGFRRYTGRANVDYQALNWLKVGTNMSYSNTEYNGTREQRNPTGWGYWYNSPSFVGYPDPFSGLPFQRSPVNVVEEQQINSYGDRIFANLYAEARFTDWLKFRSNIAVDAANSYGTEFYPSTVQSPDGSVVRWASSNSRFRRRWVNENYFTFDYLINDVHAVNVIAGMSLQQEVRRDNNLVTVDGATDKVTVANSIPRSASAFETSNALVSYYARATYNYKLKYLLSASIRTDGSSKFGEDNRYAVFPSVSAGWVVSDEPFLEDVGFLELFKIRAAWGETGNQEALGDFQHLGLVSTGYNYLGPGIAPTASGIPNTALQWEESSQVDVGFDLALFEGRISLIYDWYKKETLNLLQNQPIPYTTGFTGLTQNVGKIRNSGHDIELQAHILQGPVSWSLGGNISFLDAEIVELAPDFPSISFMHINEAGGPVGQFYGYDFQGVYATNEDVPAGNGPNGKLNSGNLEYIEGTPAFRDVNGDGSITPADRTVVGNALADYTGGLNSRIGWNGIELSVLFTFSHGNDIYHLDRGLMDAHRGLYRQSFPEAFENRWQQTGDVTNWPRVLQDNTIYNNYYRQSSQFIEDGSFLRLRNITLAYNFPKEILENIGLRSLRVYATGENLRVWTSYTGYDPEQVDFSNPLNLGNQNLSMPTSLSIIGGINIGL